MESSDETVTTASSSCGKLHSFGSDSFDLEEALHPSAPLCVESDEGTVIEFFEEFSQNADNYKLEAKERVSYLRKFLCDAQLGESLDAFFETNPSCEDPHEMMQAVLTSRFPCSHYPLVLMEELTTVTHREMVDYACMRVPMIRRRFLDATKRTICIAAHVSEGFWKAALARKVQAAWPEGRELAWTCVHDGRVTTDQMASQVLQAHEAFVRCMAKLQPFDAREQQSQEEGEGRVDSPPWEEEGTWQDHWGMTRQDMTQEAGGKWHLWDGPPQEGVDLDVDGELVCLDCPCHLCGCECHQMDEIYDVPTLQPDEDFPPVSSDTFPIAEGSKRVVEGLGHCGRCGSEFHTSDLCWLIGSDVECHWCCGFHHLSRMCKRRLANLEPVEGSVAHRNQLQRRERQRGGASKAPQQQQPKEEEKEKASECPTTKRRSRKSKKKKTILQ